MSNEIESLPIDTTLTPDNAHLIGYWWVMDVIRDDQGQIVGLEDIQHLVREEGYKLGQPVVNNPPFVPYGLYKPRSMPNQPPKKV